MKKKDIFLVILVIAFGLIVNTFKSGKIRLFESKISRHMGLKDKKHLNTFPEEEIRYKDSIKKLDIDNPAGDIEVEESKDGTIVIKPVVRVYHKNKNKAKRLYENVKLLTRKTNNKIVIQVDTDKDDLSWRRVRVAFKCLIPKDMELNLRNRYGNISVIGAGKDIVINEKHGEIFVKNVDSGVKVENNDGHVRLYGISGEIKLHSGNSNVKIKNSPYVKLRCSGSRVKLMDIQKSVDITSAVNSSVTMDNCSNVKADTKLTRLKLQNIKNRVDLSNSHASIYLEDISGDVNIKAENCKIVMNRVKTENINIKNTHNFVEIEELSCNKAFAELKHCTMDVSFDSVKERVDIKGEHANVNLTLPTSLNPSFDIVADKGKIIDKTGFNLNISEDNGILSVNTQSVNTQKGNPNITVNARYGKLFLKTSKKTSLIKPETESFEEPEKKTPLL